VVDTPHVRTRNPTSTLEFNGMVRLSFIKGVRWILRDPQSTFLQKGCEQVSGTLDLSRT
jgi:hypothetical protein